MLAGAVWKQLDPSGATTMLFVNLRGLDALVLSRPGTGLWSYNTVTWTRLSPFEATRMAAGQLDGGTRPDLVVDFGPGFGLWTYWNGIEWVPLHGMTSESLVVADLDGDGRDELIVGFGAAGLWTYNQFAWTEVDFRGSVALAAGRLH